MSDEGNDIESLQLKVAELQKNFDAQKQELENVKNENTKNKEALDKARGLNAELLLRIPSPGENPEASGEPVEDTIEAICEEVVTAVNKAYLEKYKHD